MIDTNTSLQDLFNYAVFTLTEVQKDEIFLVKDLFRRPVMLLNMQQQCREVLKA